MRLYFYRWRVEEYFRSKKQEYDFENMRVRSLKAMNCLNLMLMIHMGHLGMLIEDMDKKLLTIKIINRSKPLRNKVLVWFYQMARGIKELEKIEKREKHKQLTFRL